jgi:hypothetical protein
MTVGAGGSIKASTDGIRTGGPVAVIRHQEIEMAVIVVIDPCGRDRPQLFPSRAMTTYTSGFRHIGKSTVAIIAVQGVAVNTEDAHSYPHLVAVALNAGFRGDIRKGPVAVVAI